MNDAAASTAKTPKIAIVMYVWSDTQTVLWWLGWYLANRCDTIIIYDDHSTDGTWDLISDAGRAYDIRYMRVMRSPEHWELRKDKCHQDAIRRYSHEFDWMGFVDPDEFVRFTKHDDLKAFLSETRFDTYDAIAINWCTYGTSGAVMRSKLPPYLVCTQHSDEREPINRLVKSLVRPDKVGEQLITAHKFDVPDEKYADPEGQQVRWQQPAIGPTDTLPNWSTAFIMHLIVRSVEEFIDRVRRRPDLHHVGYDYLIQHDFSARQTPPPWDLWLKIEPIIASITRERIAGLATQLINAAYDPAFYPQTAMGIIASPRSVAEDAIVIYQLQNRRETYLYVRRDRQVVHTTPDVAAAHAMVPLLACLIKRRQTHVHLFSADAQYLRIVNDLRFLRLACYKTCWNEDHSGLGLEQVREPVLLSAFPRDAAVGQVVANQPALGPSETLTLVPAEVPAAASPVIAALRALATIPDGDISVGLLKDWVTGLASDVRTVALPSAISMMSTRQRRLLKGILPYDLPQEI